MGRRLYDVVDAPDGWSREMGYGARNAATPPFFVVTHSAPASSRLAHELGLDVAFVTEGVGAAIERARGACGDRDVVVMGGGEVLRRCIDAGLVDELRLHVAPVVLGGGTPLLGPRRWDLALVGAATSPHAAHLTYALR